MSQKQPFINLPLTYMTFSAISRQPSVNHLPPTCVKFNSIYPFSFITYFLFLCALFMIWHCLLWLVNFFPHAGDGRISLLGCTKAMITPISCYFRWCPGWCHVNDWRQWSPHTSWCSSCAPCWFWALFTTPPGNYISMYGARSLVSRHLHSVFNMNSSPEHPSVIFPRFTCFTKQSVWHPSVCPSLLS